jgi:hypothetical protein
LVISLDSVLDTGNSKDRVASLGLGKIAIATAAGTTVGKFPGPNFEDLEPARLQSHEIGRSYQG